MRKNTEVFCTRVDPELAERIRSNTAALNDRPQGFVVREALRRFYAAVDAGIIPPISENASS